MFARLDHVSIGVLDMDKARRLFCDVLGGEPLPDGGESEAGGFDWMTFMLGGKKVELVTPRTPGEGGVGRYLEKYGEGFHHLSCTVENLREAVAHCEAHGLRILGGAAEGDFRYFYIHPQDTFGALIQVVEETPELIALAGPAPEGAVVE